LRPSQQETIKELAEISQELRRDGELAFYGSEDITPHSFYRENTPESRGCASAA
jgi:hypothetical protein